MTLNLKFKKLKPEAQIPAYQSSGAAGMDICCVEDILIQPFEVQLVSTGLAVEIPPGFELQIRARSGLAAKAGIFLVNGIGTIDSDYRGEIKIIMSTCLKDPVTLKAGERVAQAVLQKVERAKCYEVFELSESVRGAGGFGSTGLSSQSN